MACFGFIWLILFASKNTIGYIAMKRGCKTIFLEFIILSAFREVSRTLLNEAAFLRNLRKTKVFLCSVF